MRDWKAALTTHLAEQRIDPTLHASALDELSSHLEELDRSRVAGGMTPAEADRSVIEELNDGALERELKRVARAVMPPANAWRATTASARGRCAGGPLRGLRPVCTNRLKPSS